MQAMERDHCVFPLSAFLRIANEILLKKRNAMQRMRGRVKQRAITKMISKARRKSQQIEMRRVNLKAHLRHWYRQINGLAMTHVRAVPHRVTFLLRIKARPDAQGQVPPVALKNKESLQRCSGLQASRPMSQNLQNKSKRMMMSKRKMQCYSHLFVPCCERPMGVILQTRLILKFESKYGVKWILVLETGSAMV